MGGVVSSISSQQLPQKSTWGELHAWSFGYGAHDIYWVTGPRSYRLSKPWGKCPNYESLAYNSRQYCKEMKYYQMQNPRRSCLALLLDQLTLFQFANEALLCKTLGVHIELNQETMYYGTRARCTFAIQFSVKCPYPNCYSATFPYTTMADKETTFCTLFVYRYLWNATLSYQSRPTMQYYKPNCRC